MPHSKILKQFSIDTLNPMQLKTLESFSKPNDLVLISPTGSGKTLAFLLPLLQILEPERKDVQALILVPSRELAIQIEQVFKQMGTGFKMNSCYGGHAVRIEKNNLSVPPAVLVGTPGRVAYHLRRHNLILDNTSTLILDEFDKSLEAGFQEEMSFIIGHLKHLTKRVLTSATPMEEIPSFTGLKNRYELNFSGDDRQSLPGLTLKTVHVKGDDKLEALLLLLGKLGARSKIVFCNHRDAVNRISTQLTKFKVEHGFYHGGLEEIDREKTLIKLRNGTTNLLVSTDLASRGLDIPGIDAVIHYQLPATEEVMMHRNGRTARMHASGTAYFLLDEKDRLPAYLESEPVEERLPSKFMMPEPGEWKTLYLSAGKKDKISKMDIVGMLLQKGKLQKDELGKIEILDDSAYAAIKRNKIEKTIMLIRNEKIKNKKIKMEIAS